MPVRYTPKPIKAEAHDVTAARALEVWYTNTSLRPILVIVSLVHTTTAAGQFCLAQLSLAAGGVSWSGWFTSHGAGEIYGTVETLVAAGGTYRIDTNITAPAAIEINRWIEVAL